MLAELPIPWTCSHMLSSQIINYTWKDELSDKEVFSQVYKGKMNSPSPMKKNNTKHVSLALNHEQCFSVLKTSVLKRLFYCFGY